MLSRSSLCGSKRVLRRTLSLVSGAFRRFSKGFISFLGVSEAFHEVSGVFQEISEGPRGNPGVFQGVKVVLWGLRTFRGFPTGGRNVPSVFKGFQGCSERFNGVPGRSVVF